MKTRRMHGRGREEEIAKLTADGKALSAQLPAKVGPEHAALAERIRELFARVEALKKTGGRRRHSVAPRTIRRFHSSTRAKRRADGRR